MVPMAVFATLDPRLALSEEFAEAVRRHVDGLATEEDMVLLQANEKLWVRALYRLLDDVAESIDRVRVAVRGHQRAIIIADLENDYRAVDAVLTKLVGHPQHPRNTPKQSGPLAETVNVRNAARVVELQLSWVPGRIIAWAAKPGGHTENAAKVLERLHHSGAMTVEWNDHRMVKLDNRVKAEAVSTPLKDCLGWLVALGTAAKNDGIGASVSWLGLVAALAVRLTAQGRMVPQIKKLRRRPVILNQHAEAHRNGKASPKSVKGNSNKGKQGKGKSEKGKSGKGRNDTGFFEVRWTPALVESASVTALAESLPGAAAAFENQRDPTAFTQAVLADIVNAIASEAASRLDVPAASPTPKNRAEVAETALARLNGMPFESPTRMTLDLARRVDQWHRPVNRHHDLPLIVQLNPPDEVGAWQLSVLSESSQRELQPAERALVLASRDRKLAVKNQLVRLERLCPELLRLGGRRRGEVFLSPDEAWGLMVDTGPVLVACGYDVRVPDLSQHRPKPALRITTLDDPDSAVGADQLANVRWSVVVDDVELTPEDIRELAQQARPLVKSRGRWVELDRADLHATAKALEERASSTRMTGADMLRHALGLEGSPLGGDILLAGHGWAADLIRSASEIPDELPVAPDGFRGRLRSYQADALVWVQFLEQVGLGGCLGLDMGLGKTPIMLAHLNLTREKGPSLVIAPPAVVGNWLSEARRFVPGLRVTVHHGPGRCSARGMPALARRSDLIITTYGTAVRDMDALEKIEWSTIVADEAQAIKNHNSETARQLRRLSGRSRVTLTGTPIENGLGDLWAIMDFCNPGLLGPRPHFIGAMNTVAQRNDNGHSGGSGGAFDSDGKSGRFATARTPSSADTTTATATAAPATTRHRKSNGAAEGALAALNGLLVFRRTKAEPVIADELPDRIDSVDHCTMTPEQIGLYQAVLDQLVVDTAQSENTPQKKGAVLAAITALKQVCNHPVNYRDDSKGISGRSGKLARLEQILGQVFAADERVLIFTHFASWGERLAAYLSEYTGVPIDCYHGGLARGARDRMIDRFQNDVGAGALVLSLKAGGTGLNLTAANHVVLYDRWWNPAVEDQARDRAWRIGQLNTVMCHRLVCPGTVDERVEEVVAGKRHIANLVLPKSSSIGDLDGDQLQAALGIDANQILIDDNAEGVSSGIGGNNRW